MIIAIEGCCHGELEKIYATIAEIETQRRLKVDLLICCGDFEAVRADTDLACLQQPEKYLKMGTFWKYYSGQLKAPCLTIFIGGNHEAANHLWELYYGGWVAPNIYYLGNSGCINVGGLRIAGVSGIFKANHYQLGYYERLPLTEDTRRSAYHTRSYEIEKLFAIKKQVTICLSHDWPGGKNGVAYFGNTQFLFSRKDGLRSDIEAGLLGNPNTMRLMRQMKPLYWFSGHHHVKFSACIPHKPQHGGFTVNEGPTQSVSPALAPVAEGVVNCLITHMTNDDQGNSVEKLLCVEKTQGEEIVGLRVREKEDKSALVMSFSNLKIGTHVKGVKFFGWKETVGSMEANQFELKTVTQMQGEGEMKVFIDTADSRPIAACNAGLHIQITLLGPDAPGMTEAERRVDLYTKIRIVPLQEHRATGSTCYLPMTELRPSAPNAGLSMGVAAVGAVARSNLGRVFPLEHTTRGPGGRQFPASDTDVVATRFLALDKCLPGRRYLQVMDLQDSNVAPKEVSMDDDSDSEGEAQEGRRGGPPPVLHYDLEWLGILKLAQSHFPIGHDRFDPTALRADLNNPQKRRQAEAWVLKRCNTFKKEEGLPYHGMKVPMNFEHTVPPYDGGRWSATAGRGKGGPTDNPQTRAFHEFMEFQDNFIVNPPELTRPNMGATSGGPAPFMRDTEGASPPRPSGLQPPIPTEADPAVVAAVTASANPDEIELDL